MIGEVVPNYSASRIMIVSADAAFLQTLLDELAGLGVGTIESLPSVQAAIARLSQEHALRSENLALILIDMVEPGGDLVAFLSCVRSVDLFRALPIVGFDGAKSWPLVHACVNKTSDPAELRAMLVLVLGFWSIANGGAFVGSATMPWRAALGQAGD